MKKKFEHPVRAIREPFGKAGLTVAVLALVLAMVGIALAIAVIRGIARREMKTIGNFWVDLTRSFLWVLLPISFVVALIFVSQGVVQNLKPYATAQLVEPQPVQSASP